MVSKSNPTADPKFRRVLKNLLSTPPKPHSEMKLGKRSGKKAATSKGRKPSASAKPRTA